MNVKLIAIDIDGTLLNDDAQVSLRTKAIIKEAQNRGILVVLATGRHLLSTLPVSNELNLTEPVISQNGGIIYDPFEKRTLFEASFSIDEVTPLIHFLRQEQILFHIDTHSHIFIEKQLADEGYFAEYLIKPTFIEDLQSIKQQIFKLSIVGEDQLISILPKYINRYIPHLQMSRSGEDSLVIVANNINKGNSLKALCETHHIHLNETIAFGNHFNDIEMLQVAGLGVAMANAPSEVQRIADHVTTSNNDDGIAILLEKLFFTKEYYSSSLSQVFRK